MSKLRRKKYLDTRRLGEVVPGVGGRPPGPTRERMSDDHEYARYARGRIWGEMVPAGRRPAALSAPFGRRESGCPVLCGGETLRILTLVAGAWLLLALLEILAGANPWARRVRRRYADQPFVRKFALDEQGPDAGRGNIAALLLFELSNAVIIVLFFTLLYDRLPAWFLTQGAVFGMLMWLPRAAMRSTYVYMTFDVGPEWIVQDIVAEFLVMISLGIGLAAVSQLV